MGEVPLSGLGLMVEARLPSLIPGIAWGWGCRIYSTGQDAPSENRMIRPKMVQFVLSPLDIGTQANRVSGFVVRTLRSGFRASDFTCAASGSGFRDPKSGLTVLCVAYSLLNGLAWSQSVWSYRDPDFEIRVSGSGFRVPHQPPAVNYRPRFQNEDLPCRLKAQPQSAGEFPDLETVVWYLRGLEALDVLVGHLELPLLQG